MYIYKITNQLNGNVYIGLKTASVEESLEYYGSGKLIQQAIKKYGKENFSKEILERNITDFNYLCERERHYIALYDSKVNGYNMTDGGLGSHGYKQTINHMRNRIEALKGRKHSDETKRKISKSAKQRRGVTLSEESKKRISLSMKGKKHSDEAKRKMRKPKPQVKSKDPCPYCGKHLSQNQMTRFHGDNCKFKK